MKKIIVASIIAILATAATAGRTDLLHLSHVHRGGGKLEHPDD